MSKQTLTAVLAGTCVALLASGCAAPSRTDLAFGDAVRAAAASQIIHPDASRNLAPPAGMEGAAAKATVDRYEKSYETPPAPVNVFAIGMGGGASGAGSAGK